jgi:flagellar biosynthesis protein FlhF
MKIKRYTAPSMRTALAQVRADQGPDAVILSSRRSDGGVEVIAAVDYDEALFSDVNRQHMAPIAEAVAAQPAPQTAPPVAPAPVAAAETLAMQRELRDLRRLLETGFAGMTTNDKRLREPTLRARVLEELSAMDIAPDVAMALAARAPLHTSMKDPAHIKLALLARHLPVLNDPTPLNGGIVAVVGPTGAGKTTTIAKFAARWCMQHGAADLALVSTDGYRVGARDQLKTFARAIGTPMHAVNSGKELAAVLQQLKSKKLVLIDTAGTGPRDFRLVEQLAALRTGAAKARILLALPAQGEAHALDEIVRAFARAAPAACIITKVDEAASLGAVISATLRHRLHIAYLCDGQRVPEDLHAAHQKRVWLVRAALDLKERASPLRNESAVARNSNGARAHG